MKLRRILALVLVMTLLTAPALAASPTPYEAARGYHEGLAAVRQNGKWGYVDEDGKTVIPPAYACAGDFSEGLAVVAVETKDGWLWYAIDRADRRLPLTYPAYAERADGGPVLQEVQVCTAPAEDDWPALSYHGGCVYLGGGVEVDASMNLVFDRQGRWVELGGYAAQGPCGDGWFPAAVVPTERAVYVGRDGVASLYFDGAVLRPFSQGLAPCGVAVDGATRWGFLDRDGDWAVAPQYAAYAVEPTTQQVFFDGVAAVQDPSGLWGAIDRTGRTVAPFEYESLSVFSEGAAAARRGGRYGLIDAAGQTLLPFVYDRLTPLSEGRAVAVRDGETLLVTRWGEERAVDAALDYYFPENGDAVLPTGPIVVARNGHWGFEAAPAATKPPEADAVAPWALDDVREAVAAGLIPAALQGSYDAPLTRRAFASLAVRLVRTLGADLPAEPVYFSDCTDPDVLAAASWGIVRGRGGGVFDPEAAITRQEAAILLTRIAELLALPPAEGEAAAFADAESVSGYAQAAVAQVHALGVMTGYPDGRFAPQEAYTRQQACLAVWRLYQIAAEGLANG